MLNFGNLLSGQQLVENGCKHDQTLPKKGPKSVISNGTWLEKKQIESALDDRRDSLKQQRVEKIGALSHATWIEEKQKALVSEKRGTFWLHMGHNENEKIYLYPEEVVHLMEMNALDLKFGGVRMSLQQVYSKFIGKIVSLDEYRVYSHLSRQGYKLIRHDHNAVYYNQSSDDEEDVSDSFNITSDRSSSKSSRSKTEMDKTKIDDPVDLNESSSDDCTMVTESVNSDHIETNDISQKEVTSLIDTDSDESSTGTDIVCLPSFSLKYKILSNIPNCYKKKYLSLNYPDDKYLPQGIKLFKRHHIIDLDEFKHSEHFNTENSNNLVRNSRFALPTIDDVLFLRYNVSANNTRFFNAIAQNYLKTTSSHFSQYRPLNIYCNGFNYQPQITPRVTIQEITNKYNNKEEQTPDNRGKEKCNVKFERRKQTSKNNYTNKKESVNLVEDSKISDSSGLSKKQIIFNKIKILLSKFSLSGLGDKSIEIKEKLILAIIKFNDTFDERYTLVFKENRCLLEKMSADNDSENEIHSNVLELSSDSDSPPQKTTRKVDGCSASCSSDYTKKRRIKRRKVVSNKQQNIIDSSSSDENSMNQIFITSNRPNKNTIDNWYTKGSWNSPEIGKFHKRNNYISGLKLSTAVLESIKEFSYKKECPIESWGQGKQLYKSKLMSNVVSISDDEVNENDQQISTSSKDDDPLIPLIRKEDCISIETILKRLQIVEPCNRQDNCASSDNAFKISYDVYYPTDKTLRKSKLSRPPFSVIITSDRDHLPTSKELYKIKMSLHKNSSFLLAIVSFDTITYIEMDNIIIPNMTRN